LEANAATAALDSHVAQPLSLSTESAAFGVAEVVAENMAAAARAHAAEFGLDLGSRDMVAFGGAAPLHAARLGEKLGVRRIVIPPQAGVGSAIGFLLAPVSYEVVRSRRQRLSEFQPAVVNRLMDDMRSESLTVVQQGAPGRPVHESRQAYMRYEGQGHEITVPLPGGTYGAEHGAVFRNAFEESYTRLYGRVIEGIEIEVLSWTLTLAAPRPQAGPVTASQRSAGPLPEPIDRQSLFDAGCEQWLEAPVYLRRELAPGHRLPGPVLITEAQTTTVVSSGFEARIDNDGSIVMSRQERVDEAT